DEDGDTDIVTGTRSIPFRYGEPGGIHIYRNQGEGIFEIVDAPSDLTELGLLTDAAVGDFNRDGKTEVVIVGEWMQPLAITWNGEKFVREALFEDMPSGLYKSVFSADFNGDGKPDLIFGNYGTNTRLSASRSHPLTWHISDYDQNGRIDHILSIYEGDTLYPLILFQDLSKQLPVMRKRFQTFSNYGNATTNNVLKGLNHSGERRLICESLESYLWLNGNSTIVPLPWQAQLSPVYAAAEMDIDQDQHMEFIIGGNQKRVKPELGAYNSSFGTVLKWKEDGLVALPSAESGFWVRGEIRQLIAMPIDDRGSLVVIRNNDNLEVFTYSE
ncbi:MAG: VCBS repeat-containing protein, partial [Cyclobacteriaceae bacterium]